MARKLSCACTWARIESESEFRADAGLPACGVTLASTGCVEAPERFPGRQALTWGVLIVEQLAARAFHAIASHGFGKARGWPHDAASGFRAAQERLTVDRDDVLRRVGQTDLGGLAYQAVIGIARSMGTSLTSGRLPLAMMTSSPAHARSTRRDGLVFASCIGIGSVFATSGIENEVVAQAEPLELLPGS